MSALESSSASKDQSATYRSASQITYEQADHLEGILTAVQIAGEQRLDIQRQILDTLQAKRLIPAFSSSALNDNSMMLSEALHNLAQNMSAIQGAVSEMRIMAFGYGDYLLGNNKKISWDEIAY